jgi:hypothetical protein
MAQAPDPFADATSEFIGIKSYVGRTLVVIPHRLETGIKSTLSEGKVYDAVWSDVIIVDGDPDEDLEIDEVPTVKEEMRVAGASIVPQLRPHLRTHKPVIGVLIDRPASNKNWQPSVALDSEKVTEAARKVARQAYADYQEAHANDKDPFAEGNGTA